MKTILYVGKLSRGKGPMLLMDALLSILKRQPGRAVFIGEGPLLGPLQAQVWALGLWDDVEFLGQVGHEHMPGHYQRADVTVVPSVWQEPFGRVALEALWWGCPIVVTNRGGLPEIARYGLSVVVEPTADGIAEGVLHMLSQPRQEPDRERLQEVFGERVVAAHVSMYRRVRAA